MITAAPRPRQRAAGFAKRASTAASNASRTRRSRAASLSPQRNRHHPSVGDSKSQCVASAIIVSPAGSEKAPAQAEALA